MSHAVDMALMLAGPAVSATAVDRTVIGRRPRVGAESGTHFSVAEGGELGDVENEDYVLSIVRFASGLVGSLEASRVTVGKHAEMGFEVHGTAGALAWDFKRMNELDVYLPPPTGDAGVATVYMGPQHPEYAAFQPGPALAMGYGDLKVIEAHLFLESVVDGVQREPGVLEMASTARVLAAMVRSFESEAWESVEPAAVPAQEPA
jgi:predicted dehydrogenase